MNKTVSNVILFVLGILLSTQVMAKNSSITFTEENSVILSGKVDDVSIANLQKELGKVAGKLSKGSTVYLLLDTPGGSVVAGNQFIDFAKGLDIKVKPVCLFCASMGYHIFQSLDERLVQESSILMSHRISVSGVGGQIPGELVTTVKFFSDMSNEMDAKVAKRIGISREQYQAMIYDELWLTGAQAVKLNHADKVGQFQCSEKLLNGRRTEEIPTLFGVVEVTYSKCPLIQGILDFKIKRVLVQPRDDKEVMSAIRKVRRMIIKEN